MPNSTVDAIITKVRRITRTPSAQQMTDAQILEYVNTFYVQDFPNWCKTLRLHTNMQTYTSVFRDYIEFDNNLIVNVEAPIYINGYQVYFTLDQQEFFGLYPQNNFNYQIATGDGGTTNFTSGINGVNAIPNAPFLVSTYSTVSITSSDINENPLVAHDDIANQADLNATPLIGSCIAGSQFSYLDGTFNVTFTSAPANGVPIFANVQPVTYGIPDTLLFFNSQFFVRPVPGTPYEVKAEVDITASDFIALADEPSLKQWWQYIAYGAAKKILEDKMDMDTVNLIMPEFKNQERLVMRKVLNELAQKRSTTLYTAPSYNTVYGWPYLNN